MSLYSLTSNRVARDLRSTTTRNSEDVTPPSPDVQNAMSALVEYIPTETISLYLATVAALPVISKRISILTPEAVYWIFAGLTPILYALIYAGKRRAAGQPRCPGLVEWPWWPTIASFVAFVVWGLAIPDAPYLTDESGRVFAGLFAVFVSVMLGVIGRVFGPKKDLS